MQIVVLIAFILTYTTQELPAPAWSDRLVWLPLIVAYLAGAASITAAWTAAGLRTLKGQGPSAPPTRGQRLLGKLRLAWLVGGSAGVAYAGYGSWLADYADLPFLGPGWQVGDVPMLGEWALILPFALAVTVSWWLEHPYHAAARAEATGPGPVPGGEQEGSEEPAFWTRREFVVFNVRHHLLFILAPLSLIVLGHDSLLLASQTAWWPANWIGEAILSIGGIAWTAGVFVCAPLLVVRVWRTRRLKNGPLRQRLEEMCQRLSFRFRDVLVWESGGVLANAGAMGVIAPVRYVLLSDALLEHMEPARVEAIFAHEAGHILHHHIFYSGLFAVSSVTLVWALAELIGLGLGLDEWTIGGLAAVGLVLVWALGFGWVSRRFERQSDVISARVMSEALSSEYVPEDRVTPVGAQVFAGALEQVARLNGMRMDGFNWRHGSISWRVNYILSLGARGGSIHEIGRLVRRIKRGLWAAVVAGIGLSFLLSYMR
jgi:STE24 endopeptidase